MRSFDKLVEKRAKKQPLKGVAVLGMQHLLGTTHKLASALAASGVEKSDITLIGKGYSQNKETVEAMRKDGMRAIFANNEQRLGYAQVGGLVLGDDPRRFLENEVGRALKKTQGKKLLVIDDGGDVIRMIHERFPQELHRVVAVEQTRKGIRSLENYDLKVPVIDVAQSQAKLKHESPMIGHSIGRNIGNKLEALDAQGIGVQKSAVIVGAGAVGMATARSLKKQGYKVGFFDTDSAALEKARAAGFTVHSSFDDAAPHANVLVSATGKSGAVGPGHLEKLPNGAVVFNAASGRDEIRSSTHNYEDPNVTGDASFQMSTKFLGKAVKLGDSREFAHLDTVLKTKNGKEIYFAQDGHVINFDGTQDPIPSRYIQLTRGLLYLGANQAVRAKKAGILKLNHKAQRKLVGAVKKELKETGESLSDPSF
jgi:S-adenosylhomocysteine hydrolase